MIGQPVAGARKIGADSMKHVTTRTCLAMIAALGCLAAASAPAPIPVNIGNFTRAETDMYMGKAAQDGAFGQLRHRREPAAIDRQDVVRMNRDTLYSNGVFDLEAAPVTITLPDSGKRFMSMQVLSQDQYTTEVVYAPGRHTYTKEKVGTRYVYLIIRTLADAQDPGDVKKANALQDQIKVEQASSGKFEVPQWDSVSQDKARKALLALGSLGGLGTMFGRKDEVDPVSFLIASAAGWGGNPPSAAVYQSVYPKENDGRTAHRLTVEDVPVDGFWSISVYNADGFFEKNDLDAYSVNNLTAGANSDGSYTIQFGGCEKATPNCLPITAGWNYTVRLYRPRKAILDMTWTFPEAQPVR
jgi:para-nitrobenzyl esterase